jgi:hypothetical protein
LSSTFPLSLLFVTDMKVRCWSPVFANLSFWDAVLQRGAQEMVVLIGAAGVRLLTLVVTTEGWREERTYIRGDVHPTVLHNFWERSHQKIWDICNSRQFWASGNSNLQIMPTCGLCVSKTIGIARLAVLRSLVGLPLCLLDQATLLQQQYKEKSNKCNSHISYYICHA